MIRPLGVYSIYASLESDAKVTRTQQDPEVTRTHGTMGKNIRCFLKEQNNKALHLPLEHHPCTGSNMSMTIMTPWSVKHPHPSVLGTSNQNTKNTIRYLKGTPWSKWGQICVDSYGHTVTSWFIRSELLGLLFSTDSTAKQNSGRVENLPLHASHLVNQFEDALAALVQISIARLLHKAEVEHSTQSAWWCFCSICICSVCFSDCIDWLTHSIPKNRPKIRFAGSP